MIRFAFLLVFPAILSYSCNNNQPTIEQEAESKSDSSAVINDATSKINFQTSNFVEIDSSGILLFPLSGGESKRENGEFYYKEMPNNNYWNILFHNTKSNTTHLLSEKKILIQSFHPENGRFANQETNQFNQYIYYEAISHDYNRDKKLSNSDPVYLFISDKLGGEFRQISPSNGSVINWKFVHSSKKIIMTVKKDSDKNFVFDEGDETAAYEYNPGNESGAVEIFSTELKNKLKSLYNRDWKIK